MKPVLRKAVNILKFWVIEACVEEVCVEEVSFEIFLSLFFFRCFFFFHSSSLLVDSVLMLNGAFCALSVSDRVDDSYEGELIRNAVKYYQMNYTFKFNPTLTRN